MAHDARPVFTLIERTGFWLAMAVVLATFGAAGMAIGIAEYHRPWTSAWFMTGAVVSILGCLSALWALVLYVAHKVADDHWCPAPQTHIETTRRHTTAITNAVVHRNRVEQVRWLLPTLREINGDLGRAAAGIQDAVSTDSYKGLLSEFQLEAWRTNQERFAALEGHSDLFNSLQEAHRHIARIRRILTGTPDTPGPNKPRTSDDLRSALFAIHRAEAVVTTELSDLDK